MLDPVRRRLLGLIRLLNEDRHEDANALRDGRDASLSTREQAMIEYAIALTTSPGSMTSDHVDALRTAGLDDRAIHDLAQAIGYFCYVNRIVLGLGVSLDGESLTPGQWPNAEA
ncbi:MAG: hypothetical protein AAF432_11900 [Planctomycetota bacterium]